MLPIENKKGNALTTKETYGERKIRIIETPEVIQKLSDRELMVARAGLGNPIAQIQDAELVKKIAVASKYICRDLGIKDWNNPEIMKYDATRFLTTLKNYYKDLSIQEVKVAFELAAVGDLDEWLPKDKNGDPDRNHYQAFSLSFYTKILNAYRAKKNKTWFKATKALPVAKNVISKEQREHNRKELINDIHNSFYKYKDEGVEPKFILSIFVKEFVEQGVFKDVPVASKKTVNKAFNLFVLSDLPKSQKKPIIKDFHQNKISHSLQNTANNMQANIEIKRYFDRLIKKGQDIKQFIK